MATGVWKLVGNGVPKAEIGDYEGRVTNVLQSGMGFVDCPKLKEQFRQDCFIHRSVMEQCALQKHDYISFCVHVNGHGSPQVSAPVWKYEEGYLERAPHVLPKSAPPIYLRSPPTNTGLLRPKIRAGQVESGLPAGIAAIAAMGGLRGQAKGQAKGQTSGVRRFDGKGVETAKSDDLQPPTVGWMPEAMCAGVVCKLDHARGITFIRCQDGRIQGDVYCHNSVLDVLALELGDIVAFTLYKNKKGQSQASGPVWKRAGWSKKDAAVDFYELQGIIARELPGGSCMVNCPTLEDGQGKETYIHRKVIETCGVGLDAVISFNAHISPNGTPQVSMPLWVSCSSDKFFRPYKKRRTDQGPVDNIVEAPIDDLQTCSEEPWDALEAFLAS